MDTIASTPFGQIASDLTFSGSTFDSAQDGTSSASFSSVLTNALQQVNSLQNDASDQAQAFALGQTSDIHSVMIAAQKATVALDMATEVRSKVLEAYQQIMQIQM
jgi:flagellar hook-basal body complex protein FliE